MTHFGFPYRIGPDGRTAGASADEHVRQLIELVLFTEQGERLNRLEFGAGVRQLVFAGNSPELATAAQHLITSALQRWLAELVAVVAVDVTAAESTLAITVRFRAVGKSEERSLRLVREV